MKKLIYILLFSLLFVIASFTGCSGGNDIDNVDVTTFIVSFDSQGATTPASPSSMIVEEGGIVTHLPATPFKTGYVFGGWFTEINGGGEQFTTSTAVTNHMWVFAKWIDLFTVSFNSQGGSTVESQVVNFGGLVTEPSNPIHPGAVFDGWYRESACITPWVFGSNVVTNNVILYAKWILVNRNWRSITSSSDGSKLAAVVNNGQIYTSTDSGVNWTPRDSNRNWFSITSSSDGSKLAAVVSFGKIYTSTDSGINWIAQDTNRDWVSITSSSDGIKLAAVVSLMGQFCISTDSGVTWTIKDTNQHLVSIASSSDGSKLAVVGNFIFTSTDFGVTWILRGSNRNWNSITSSSNGTKLAAVVRDGQIYTSSNSGITWAARDSNRDWRSITSSSDGTKLAAVVRNGQIYTSIDSGVTWIARDSNRDWRSITSSSDGTKLAAVVRNGQIYTSTDSGVTWVVRF